MSLDPTTTYGQEGTSSPATTLAALDPCLASPLLRALFDNTALAVAVLNLDGKVIAANRTLLDWLGLDAESMALPRPEEDAASAQAWQQLASGRRERLDVERRFARQSGHEVWGRISASLVRDAAGAPRSVACIVADISAQKDAEKMRDVLASTERLRTLGEMAGGVAHDLNQSLALIAGHGDLARRALDASTRDEQALRRSMETIARAAMDGGATVRRLLSFSHGETRVDPILVELGDLLREVASLTAPRWRDAVQAQGRPIHLRVQVVEGAPILVRGWPHALREAITNLVFNAVDAMPYGGDITLGAGQVGDNVYVQVQDTGTGMPPEVQARLFDTFFTTKGEHGTGLGLPLVADTMRQHQGSIQVASAIGRGTTFTLALPAADGAAAPTPTRGRTAPARERNPVGSLRILIVDDEPRLLEMLAAMLDGHAVRRARSAEDALAALADEPADLVISDLGMGDTMNGWDLAGQVRQRWPATRFALTTGWGSSIGQAEARARGVVAILAKPYRIEDLQALLERIA